MSFQPPLTIKEAVDQINSKKLLLPPFQREFFWNHDQMTHLFDSITLGHPIGSFVFWEIKPENVDKFAFYEFIKDWHVKSCDFNPKATPHGNDPVITVLDGQQRLASLYTGLLGSLSYRDTGSIAPTYIEERLFLNLLQKRDDEGCFYDFEIMSEDNSGNSNEKYWFPVKNILDISEPSSISKYLESVISHLKNIEEDLNAQDVNIKLTFAEDTLNRLWHAIHSDKSINYYLEKNQDISSITNIFINLNGKGEKLTKDDLLLVKASELWKKADLRGALYKATNEITDINGGFYVDYDFLLKASLFLNNWQKNSLKANDIDPHVLQSIQSEWDSNIGAIKEAVSLVSQFGFSGQYVTSNYLYIPIAYYIKKTGFSPNLKPLQNSDKIIPIKKWFIASTLKEVLKSKSNLDNVLGPISEIIDQLKNGDDFPFNEIINRFKDGNYSISFTDNDISEILDFKYNDWRTLCVMSILYPYAIKRNSFDIDHLFPRSVFKSEDKMREKGIPARHFAKCQNYYDCIGNLLLLDMSDNRSKGDVDFKTWVEKTFKTKAERNDFFKDNLIPKNSDFEWKNYIAFHDARDGMIWDKLRKLLP